jgi:hypothetical protein
MAFDWKTLVKTVAPTIASVFGTPLAGMGVTALLNVLLPTDAPRPADPESFIAQALSVANPDLLLKVKQAEEQFTLDLKRLDIDLAKFLDENAVKNTASARDLKVQWMKSDKWDYEPYLATAVCLAFGYAEWWVFQYAVAIHTMEPNQAILIGRVLGTVDAAFMILLNFRWGNSRSSEQKNDTISTLAQNANPTPTK